MYKKTIRVLLLSVILSIGSACSLQQNSFPTDEEETRSALPSKPIRSVMEAEGEDSLKEKLGEMTKDDIVEFYHDDFDKNGTFEAFAVTGDVNKYGEIQGTLWFVNANETTVLLESGSAHLQNPSALEHENCTHFMVNLTPVYPPVSKCYIWRMVEGTPVIVFQKNGYLSKEENVLTISYSHTTENGRIWSRYDMFWDAINEYYDEVFSPTKTEKANEKVIKSLD